MGADRMCCERKTTRWPRCALDDANANASLAAASLCVPTSYRDSPADDKDLVPRHPVVAFIFVAWPIAEMVIAARTASPAGATPVTGVNSAFIFFHLHIAFAHIAGVIAALATKRSRRSALARTVALVEFVGWMTCSLLAPGPISGTVLLQMLLHFGAALFIPVILWAWMLAKRA